MKFVISVKHCMPVAPRVSKISYNFKVVLEQAVSNLRQRRAQIHTPFESKVSRNIFYISYFATQPPKDLWFEPFHF
jgi:hypothetical protein